MANPHANYKTCKQCGNRNHPSSGVCHWCGAHLWGTKDWFSAAGIILIVLLVIGLGIYAKQSRSPMESKIRLPGASQSAE